MNAVAPLLAATAVLVVAARYRRPRPVRRPAALGKRRSPTRPDRVDPLEAIGRGLRRCVGRPPDRRADRRVGLSAVVAVLTLPAGAVVSITAGVVTWALPAIRSWRSGRRRRADVAEQLPDVADLLLVAIEAGLTVRLGLGAVASGVTGVVADAFETSRREIERGRRVADAVEGLLAALGDDARPVIDVLLDSERYGTPLREPLERVVGELRVERRRRAEEAARRVPVKLLFPLVFCTLPAFGLLTVVPLLAGSLPSLPR